MLDKQVKSKGKPFKIDHKDTEDDDVNELNDDLFEKFKFPTKLPKKKLKNWSLLDQKLYNELKPKVSKVPYLKQKKDDILFNFQ